MSTINPSPKLLMTDRFKAVIHQIPSFSLCVIAAPMGYGKSTLARALGQKTSHRLLWLSVESPSPLQFWEGFCSRFRAIDQGRAETLLLLGLPDNPVSRQQALDQFSQLYFPDETFLVIDDYHLVDHPDLHHFLTDLARRQVARFHLVVTSRNEAFDGLEELVVKEVALSVTREDLEFLVDDILRYFATAGLHIDTSQARRLHQWTEGWVSALYLCLASLEKNPDFFSQSGGEGFKSGALMSLVDSAVFRPLGPQEKEFLLRVAPFDTFTLAQAEFIFPGPGLTTLVRELLGHNAFVVFDGASGLYRMHSILTQFLRQELGQSQAEFRLEVFHRAAEWYRKEELYWLAMDYYYRSGDYPGFLQTLEQDKANSLTNEHKQTIIGYMEALDSETKMRYPRALLIYARRLFSYNERGLFNQLASFFLEYVTQSSWPEGEKRELLGELEVILSFAQFNDIEKMSVHHRRAFELLQAPTQLSNPGGSWTFGSPSVLYLFHRKPGALGAEVQTITQAMPFYYALSLDHGKGAEHVMAAERHFLLGQFDDAEITVHKVLNVSLDQFNSGIAVCALFLLARLALVRGDYPQVVSLFSRLRHDLVSSRQFLFLHTLDVCEAFVYSSLGVLEKVPPWIRDGELRNSRLLFPALGYLNIVWGRVLLAQGEYLKLIGMGEHFLKVASIFPNTMGQLVCHLQLAAAYAAIHRREDALASLLRAVELAEPDGILVPFTEVGEGLLSLFGQFPKTSRAGIFLSQVVPLAENFRQTVAAIKSAHFQDPWDKLTRREQEVVALAAQDLTNIQIADQLGISTNTVKTILKFAFDKLNVTSRSQLRAQFKK